MDEDLKMLKETEMHQLATDILKWPRHRLYPGGAYIFQHDQVEAIQKLATYVVEHESKDNSR